jgi:hypothetical protein
MNKLRPAISSSQSTEAEVLKPFYLREKLSSYSSDIIFNVSTFSMENEKLNYYLLKVIIIYYLIKVIKLINKFGL